MAHLYSNVLAEPWHTSPVTEGHDTSLHMPLRNSPSPDIFQMTQLCVDTPRRARVWRRTLPWRTTVLFFDRALWPLRRIPVEFEGVRWIVL